MDKFQHNTLDQYVTPSSKRLKACHHTILCSTCQCLTLDYEYILSLALLRIESRKNTISVTLDHQVPSLSFTTTPIVTKFYVCFNEEVKITSFILFFGPCIFSNEDKKTQQNAQINSGLIYYWSITPTCFGPSVEAIIREFEFLESYKAIVLIC